MNLEEEQTNNILPAISKIERVLILKKIIKDNTKIPNVNDEQAYFLATELARLIDNVEMEELTFDNLKNIVPEEYSIYWQETLNFLKVITDHYPTFLKDRGLLNPVARKIKLIKKQIESWKVNKRDGRIFVAGSTGSLVPISYMLRSIYKMENGYLILPGLDKNLKDFDIELLTSTYPKTNQNHPQYSLVKLVKLLELNVHDIPDIPIYKNYDVVSKDREILTTKIMSSADMEESLSFDTPLNNNILDDVNLLNLDTETDEIFALTCLLRKAVSENKKAMLITPDRVIAKSVANELLKWNIQVDDSAGTPASDTITGNYLLLVMKMIVDNFSPLSLLAVLKHKYTMFGYTKEVLNNLTEKLEKEILIKYQNLNTLDDLLIHADKLPELKDFLLRIQNYVLNCLNIHKNNFKDHIYNLLYKHIELSEQITNTNDKSFNILWQDDISTSLANELKILLNELKDINEIYSSSSIDIDLVTPQEYYSFISKILLSISLRAHTNHSNIIITNSIEARLLDADYYIMSGLNEEIFPRLTAEDPWMNRSMKAKFNLPLPEKKIGLSSHDFAEFFCKQNVILTRANRINGINTIASRWLIKLDAIVKLNNIKWDNSLKDQIDSWKNFLFPQVSFLKCERPSPRPPLGRPKVLSATSIEKWFQDPYIIFASKILGLNKLDNINRKIDHRDFGNLIHNSLEIFKNSKNQSEDFLKELFYTRSKVYENIPQIHFWYTKFNDISKWFTEYENTIKDSVVKTFTEIEGSYKITPNFTIKAKADRIDLLKDNTVIIYDYKTGTPPTVAQVATGYYPQLLVEALIIQNQGFPEIKINKVSSLKYLKLGTASDCKVIEIDNVDELVKDAEKKLIETIHLFEDINTPYISRPNKSVVGDSIKRYSEYSHLARIKEWDEN